MEKSKLQKMKLLFLLEMLRVDSDEEHPLCTADIISRLNGKGVSCDRRTLAKDIALLNEQGYEVMSVTCSRQKGYYVEDRSFSVPELRILMDAVQAARFVTEKKTEELTEKIAALGDSNRAQMLKQNAVHFNTRKYSNEAVYYTVNTLNEALSLRRKVSFFYFDLNDRLEKVYRHDKRRYTVEPVALVLAEDRYYLTAISPDREGPSVYRIDRMEGTEIESEQISEEAVKKRDSVPDYAGRTFKMFSGPEVNATLVFDDNLVGAVLDRFGEDAHITRLDGNKCQCVVPVSVSPPFWGWIFQFGRQMQITAPDTLKGEYVRRLKEAAAAMMEEKNERLYNRKRSTGKI